MCTGLPTGVLQDCSATVAAVVDLTTVADEAPQECPSLSQQETTGVSVDNCTNETPASTVTLQKSAYQKLQCALRLELEASRNRLACQARLARLQEERVRVQRTQRNSGQRNGVGLRKKNF